MNFFHSVLRFGKEVPRNHGGQLPDVERGSQSSVECKECNPAHITCMDMVRDRERVQRVVQSQRVMRDALRPLNTDISILPRSCMLRLGYG